MRGIRFIPQNTTIDFARLRFITFFVSFILVAGSIALTATRGLNLGIDFTGGTLIEIRTPDTPDLEHMRNRLNTLGYGAISIQEFGQDRDLLIRVQDQKVPVGAQEEDALELNKAAIEGIKAALDAMYKDDIVDYRRIEFVGPQVGKELQITGLYAILLSLAGILGYLWFRFEWQFAVAGVFALSHDVIATIGFFALTQMEFNTSTVAAVLLVGGYSINDTVVVFDRIRDDLRKYKKKSMAEILNVAVNQTLSRTTMTSLTTLLALFALFLFGGEVIRGFSAALIVGIGLGTCSSIFVAAPLLIYLNVRRTPSQTDDTQTQAEST